MPLRRQLRAVESEVQELAPQRLHALPLLGPLLNLPIPENEFTQSLEPAERKTALQALLLDCLAAAAREAGESGSGLFFVLEDLHWIDPASFELLELLAQSIIALPVVILAAYRPVTHPPTPGAPGRPGPLHPGAAQRTAARGHRTDHPLSPGPICPGHPGSRPGAAGGERGAALAG